MYPRGRKTHLFVVLLLLLGCTTQLQAKENTQIGVITSVRGSVHVVNAGVSEAVQAGSQVYIGDTFETGEDSGVKLLFDDDTLVSLGDNTSFEVTEFVYTASVRNTLYEIFTGTLKAIIQKLDGGESTVEFTAPRGVIGIKGTVLFIDADEDIFYIKYGVGYLRGLMPGAKEFRLGDDELSTIDESGNPTPPKATDRDELSDEFRKHTMVPDSAPSRYTTMIEEYTGKPPPVKTDGVRPPSVQTPVTPATPDTTVTPVTVVEPYVPADIAFEPVNPIAVTPVIDLPGTPPIEQQPGDVSPGFVFQPPGLGPDGPGTGPPGGVPPGQDPADPVGGGPPGGVPPGQNPDGPPGLGPDGGGPPGLDPDGPPGLGPDGGGPPGQNPGGPPGQG